MCMEIRTWTLPLKVLRKLCSKQNILNIYVLMYFCYLGWSLLDILKIAFQEKLERVQIKREATKA